METEIYNKQILNEIYGKLEYVLFKYNELTRSNYALHHHLTLRASQTYINQLSMDSLHELYISNCRYIIWVYIAY